MRLLFQRGAFNCDIDYLKQILNNKHEKIQDSYKFNTDYYKYIIENKHPNICFGILSNLNDTTSLNIKLDKKVF